MRTAIISAMQSEISAVSELLEDSRPDDLPGMKICSGSICGCDAVLAVSGEGKVNAAACTQTLILRYKPDCVINIGVAGGIEPSMRPGDIIVADSCVQHDFDVSALGYEPGWICSLHEKFIPCDRALSDALYRAASGEPSIRAVYRGVIATGDIFVSSSEKTHKIATAFGAVAADMETAAVAQVCRMNGIAFAAVRAVSDSGGDGAEIDYDRFEAFAADMSSKIIGVYFAGMTGVD